MLKLSPRAKQIILAIKRLEYLSAKASLNRTEAGEAETVLGFRSYRSVSGGWSADFS